MPIATLADITRHHARLRPEAVAIRFDGRDTSYGALDRLASKVANGLIAAGVKPQARIALLDKNSDTFFQIWFGATKANAVLVPVNWRLAGPEVAYVVNDAGAEVLFVGADFVETLAKIRGELKTVRTVIVIERDYPAWRDRHSDADPMLAISGGDVAAQLYTSGTTGHPKGAQLTNDNLMALLPAVMRDWGGWTPADVNLVCMPLFHIGGSGWGLCGLYGGLRNVMTREFVPQQILDLIGRERITMAIFVPAMILFLTQCPGIREADLGTLRLIVYGASPIPVELLRTALTLFPHTGFGQTYGLTETTGGITWLGPADHADPRGERLLSCGKPMGGVELRILDEKGEPLPPGKVGEIACRTKQIMKGYWNLPQETARAVRGDWFRTGDAGYLDQDGYLYIYDRVKDMIVSGGENIYPAEVESALYGHPAVADAAVIGVPDERWGEAVKAIVVLKPGQTASAGEIVEYARERIAAYKVPRSVDFADALPRNPSGKILKRELREPYWKGQTRRVH
jgi:acyl-CoA synthetase (AMP-forming)/AMP-acid ligase II